VECMRILYEKGDDMEDECGGKGKEINDDE
jgi:hypothetical protein